MNILKYTTALALSIGASLAATSAHAQFVGDIFATEPSVNAQTGEEATVSFEAFVGDAPFGASQLTLTYDPTLLQYKRLETDSLFDERGGNYLQVEEGEINVILANTESLTEPRGTVDLFQISFDVLADSGVMPIEIINKGLLLADSTDITGSGFGAEIVISGLQTNVALKQTLNSSAVKPLVISEESPLFERISKLTQRGLPVTIRNSDGSEDIVIVMQEGERIK